MGRCLDDGGDHDPHLGEARAPSGAGGLVSGDGAHLDGTPLIAPAEEGIASVELANAMILSGLQNRTVSLPLDAAEYEGVLKGLIAGSREKKAVVETGPADLAATYG